ncbi:MAG: methylamine utilization protein, partial [Steroidobacter sp.]
MKAGKVQVATLQMEADLLRRNGQVIPSGMHWSLRYIYALLTAMLWANLSSAATLQVQVHDRNGQPLNNVVITVSDRRGATSADTNRSTANHSYVMDQINLRFVPQLLVVPVNASVSFPNSDTVSHQVYSFSKSKSFQLSLYKGKPRAPIIFDKPGLVVLGCNIHDDMIGYIYVTDAHWFGQTDNAGTFTLPDISSDKVSITIWSPLIADDAASLSREVSIADS